MIWRMRPAVVYLAVIALVAVSLAVGWVAVDWPHLCQLLQWCDGQGLL
jgi:hypothetical protein